MHTNQTILGIDPGTNKTGYGILRRENNGRLLCVQVGVFVLDHTANPYEKLSMLRAEIQALLDEFSVGACAIERPFGGKNMASFLSLSRAQGVILAEMASRSIPITEYSPQAIKLSVTGNGRASKQRVEFALEQSLRVRFSAAQLDATDALATAYCHANHRHNAAAKRRANSWEEFVQANTDRILSSAKNIRL